MKLNIEFEEYDLDNGLHLILHRDNRVPIVAVNLWYKVGSKNEQIGKTGFAHLFEHMMFQGSEHVPADMHFQLIQSVGGTLNGSTFFDRTNYFETLPSNYLELGLWLESDRMGYLLPAMTQEKLDTQRDVVKNERLQRVDNQPYGIWFEKILELAYPENYPYHWPVIGYMQDLDNAMLDDINQFFKTFYAPNNATLVLTGDIDIKKSIDLVKKYFGEIPAGPSVPSQNFLFEINKAGEKRTTLYDKVQLPRLYIGYHIPKHGSQELYITDVITDLFSQGRSGRLYQELVFNKQVAQDANAFILPMQETSMIIFIVTGKPDSDLGELEKLVDAEIGKLQNDAITDEELQRVKNQLEARKIRELQSVSTKADNLNLFSTYFNNPSLINDEILRYEEITKQDIQNITQTYLVKENKIVLEFYPELNHKS